MGEERGAVASGYEPITPIMGRRAGKGSWGSGEGKETWRTEAALTMVWIVS